MVVKNSSKYIPDRGDLVWMTFEPALGHEQKGKRPALVISPKSYNAKSGLLLACPVTSISKGYPFEVPVESSKIKGVILADHIRSLDWSARSVKKSCKVPSKVLLQVQNLLQTLLSS